MLEVGVTNKQNMPSYLSHTEARTHFNLWCITSSPLILGLDLSNATTVDSIWDIITNTGELNITNTCESVFYMCVQEYNILGHHHKTHVRMLFLWDITGN